MLKTLTLLFLTALLCVSCSKDPFKDITLARTVINGKEVSKIKTELTPGDPVIVKLKNTEELRFTLKEVGEDKLVGEKNEVVLFKDIEYIEFISKSAKSFVSRLLQLFLAFLSFILATIMVLASAFAKALEWLGDLF